MILAVASGKGGTGKTTVSLNLARAFGSPVRLLDCDVEEPNCGLFLAGAVRSRETVSIPIPEVDASLCDACGECSRFCEYNAIASLGAAPTVFAEMCHGCGGCALVCPRGAIRERPWRVGTVETIDSGPIELTQGRLDIGVAMAPPLIQAVRTRDRGDIPAIIDAPPGTSCPVIAAIRGADFTALVTEPTPFGLHDLTLAVHTARGLGLRFGVVLNRAGSGDDRVHRFCEKEGIPLLAEIPDDRRIAEAYSRGELIVDAIPGYKALFEGLLEKTMGAAARGGGNHADV
jgi:MinD superfamily P-loop ATPase